MGAEVVICGRSEPADRRQPLFTRKRGLGCAQGAGHSVRFDRDAARGMRLDIAAGTAVRFEPGQRREVQLIPIGGARKVYGFNQQVMGAL